MLFLNKKIEDIVLRAKARDDTEVRILINLTRQLQRPDLHLCGLIFRKVYILQGSRVVRSSLKHVCYSCEPRSCVSSSLNSSVGSTLTRRDRYVFQNTRSNSGQDTSAPSCRTKRASCSSLISLTRFCEQVGTTACLPRYTAFPDDVMNSCRHCA